MAPQRKRETRENQFYNVGVQGRKTGITLEDRGIYDANGLEPISGIFSSPEKSPPKRASTATGSESMELQESSIPELKTTHQLLRSSRTLLPPPRSKSPKKTALGSSPRRQSSMAHRAMSVNESSPARAASHPAVARRLDFDQDESSLQETPALSGSGARRGQRADVYDVPTDGSPSRQLSAIIDESLVQEELTANDGSVMVNEYSEESFVRGTEDDAVIGADAEHDYTHVETSEPEPEPAKQPARRGRKRKSDALESLQAPMSGALRSRNRGAGALQSPGVPVKGKRTGPMSKPAAGQRRSKRVSNANDQNQSILDIPVDNETEGFEQVSEVAAPPKRRGRVPRARVDEEKENPPPAQATTSKQNEDHEPLFKKPAKPIVKPKSKSKAGSNSAGANAAETTPSSVDGGKLVNAYGDPLSKKDIEQMSTASVNSRYGRGRHLSVYRELEPEAVARVGRTGRHRVAPIDFWKNDRIAYDPHGNMTSIVKNQDTEEPRKEYRGTGKKGRKPALNPVQEEEVELDPWEANEGAFVGNYKIYDPITKNGGPETTENTIAWAEKGIESDYVHDHSFKYLRMGSVNGWFIWGIIELDADQMKRSKNCRQMHMVFVVQFGTVEVKVDENEFTVHRNGIWQVPRGNTYSVKNLGSGKARVFFAQAKDASIDDQD